jgi:hypothetical protein
MNSGRSAGISPYDGPAVIINIFIIDNPGFLKIHFISNGSRESNRKIPKGLFLEIPMSMLLT